MNINVALNRIATHVNLIDTDIVVRNQIICKDGFKVSVQASAFHYCSPRKTQKYHNSFELMCDISNDKDLLEDYYDGSICGYVPKTIVEKLILRHKGIDWKLTTRKKES